MVDYVIKSYDEVDGKQMINEYKVWQELGNGSYGTVRLVLNMENGKRYAMKETPRKLISKPQGILSAEVNILKKLNHRNVIKLYEFMNDPQQTHLYLVFEYAAGGSVMTLDQFGVAEKTLDPYFVRKIVIQVVCYAPH